MTVVLDTNVVLQARAPGHEYHRILQGLLAGQFILAASTAILLEYEEILTARVGAARWQQFTAVLDAIGVSSGNIRQAEPSFRWRLIAADPDDDKFADCAIAAEADWIITEDAHFDGMKGSGHKPQPISPEDFIRRFLAASES